MATHLAGSTPSATAHAGAGAGAGGSDEAAAARTAALRARRARPPPRFAPPAAPALPPPPLPAVSASVSVGAESGARVSGDSDSRSHPGCASVSAATRRSAAGPAEGAGRAARPEKAASGAASSPPSDASSRDSSDVTRGEPAAAAASAKWPALRRRNARNETAAERKQNAPLRRQNVERERNGLRLVGAQLRAVRRAFRRLLQRGCHGLGVARRPERFQRRRQSFRPEREADAVGAGQPQRVAQPPAESDTSRGEEREARDARVPERKPQQTDGFVGLRLLERRRRPVRVRVLRALLFLRLRGLLPRFARLVQRQLDQERAKRARGRRIRRRRRGLGGRRDSRR